MTWDTGTPFQGLRPHITGTTAMMYRRGDREDEMVRSEGIRGWEMLPTPSIHPLSLTQTHKHTHTHTNFTDVLYPSERLYECIVFLRMEPRAPLVRLGF